jgi:hypothetical protein
VVSGHMGPTQPITYFGQPLTQPASGNPTH